MGRSDWNWALFGCLALAGCVEQPALSSADALALLSSGRQALTCRERCLAEWKRVEPQAAELNAAARWTDLAMLLLQTGYEDDLSLYYLGRAAEGLRYPAAASSYYRQSSRLSGTVASCQNLSRMCGGITLPRAALLREAAITREFNRAANRAARPERRRPSRAETPVSEMEPSIPAPGSNEAVEPPIALTPAPSGEPARRRPGSDYIEPPPAAH
jgi:hypothetical protein